jgi:hypothetical protein
MDSDRLSITQINRTMDELVKKYGFNISPNMPWQRRMYFMLAHIHTKGRLEGELAAYKPYEAAVKFPDEVTR